MNRIAYLGLLTIFAFAGAMAYQITAASALLYSSLPYAYAQEDNYVNLGSTFSLRLGQAAVIESEGIVARFERVAEDSRCPVETECVWQGRVIIVVSVQVNDEDKQNLMLTMGDEPHPSAAFDQYSIRLLELSPYPTNNGQIKPGDYIATLVVSMPSQNSNGVFVRAVSDDGNAAVIGWNLEKGKGTLVLFTKQDDRITRTVYRFVPWANDCLEQQARNCMDSLIVQNTTRGGLSSVGAWVIDDKLYLNIGGGISLLYVLEITNVRTN